MIIVPMDEKTLPQVYDIEQACIEEAWSFAELTKVLSYDNYSYFVACEGDTVLGYAGAYYALDEANVTNIAVLGEYRKRGVATALLRQLCDEAKKRAARNIFLEVRASNSQAIALYERFGFRRIGVRKGFYSGPREDGFLYSYLLDK